MVLEGIVRRQREALAAAASLEREAELKARLADAPPLRDFAAALLAGPEPALIAECKRRSPVKGLLRADYSVAELTRAYERGGASALSVLTSDDFDGRLEHLREARQASTLPILRKDFILDPLQLLEARAFGADAALLIVRILAPDQLRDLVSVARQLGLQTLVEVYAADEIELAIASAPDMIGVNQRDLTTFEVNAKVLAGVSQAIGPDVPMVVESGISSRDDVLAAAGVGARAVLVGESLVTSADPAAKARELLGG